MPLHMHPPNHAEQHHESQAHDLRGSWVTGVGMHTGGMTSPARHRLHVNDTEVVRSLLASSGSRWAVVGLSENPTRVAYRIGRFLQDSLGMEIVPVHPKADTVHGAHGYRTLAEIPGDVDVVDVFVRSELAGDIVDQAIAKGVKAVWLQLGVVDEDAAARAAAAGLEVVMDTCPAIEAPRLGVA